MDEKTTKARYETLVETVALMCMPLFSSLKHVLAHIFQVESEDEIIELEVPEHFRQARNCPEKGQRNVIVNINYYGFGEADFSTLAARVLRRVQVKVVKKVFLDGTGREYIALDIYPEPERKQKETRWMKIEQGNAGPGSIPITGSWNVNFLSGIWFRHICDDCNAEVWLTRDLDIPQFICVKCQADRKAALASFHEKTDQRTGFGHRGAQRRKKDLKLRGKD